MLWGCFATSGTGVLDHVSRIVKSEDYQRTLEQKDAIQYIKETRFESKSMKSVIEERNPTNTQELEQIAKEEWEKIPRNL